ncbi:MAG TPA: Flp pilus assembly complex ATPase component TadA [Desulfuromonadales bacterium]|nr:Flp pilus assembly complex ATPase component TadA [Desulfuromonadales bacterium]
MPVKKIGELLVEKKLITAEQFAEALDMQRLSPTQPFGQLLCQLGYLKAVDLDFVLDHNDKRLKLGDILISQNLINEERLNNALIVSKSEGIPLGRALVKQHLIDEEQLARAIASQHDLKFVDLHDVSFDKDVARFINSSYAQRHRLVPIRFRDKCLTVAMAYPLRHDELAQLELWCNKKLVPVIARESDILIAQQKLYKFRGTFGSDEVSLEVADDQGGESGKSKYVGNYISADVDMLVKKLITTGIRDEASDIHLESTEQGMQVRYRIDGILQTIDLGADEALIGPNARQILSKIKIMCDMDIAERRRPQDSSFKMKVSKGGNVRGVDFRVSTVPTQYGENITIRILDKRSGVITLESLGYTSEHTAALYQALDKPTGIFLVTGPTGSGKSSTLYAILSRLNTPVSKTLTIEDPIEYAIDGITQTEVNEVIGNSFARLLRAFLRQDPDNIMVGEIRDLETAAISMRAALTGHTVLSTLHTNDATSAVTRLIDMGVEPNLISTTLRCVLAQRLVRRICNECRCHYTPAAGLLAEFGISSSDCGIAFIQGSGCPSCNFTGFSGRLPIVELWIPTRDELLMLNRKPDNQALRKTVFSQANRLTMIEDGFRRVQAGETTLDELLRVVPFEQIEAGREKIAGLLSAH